MLKQVLLTLNKKELINLIDKYDDYILEFCETNSGRKLYDEIVPVCVLGFYYNKYKNID